MCRASLLDDLLLAIYDGQDCPSDIDLAVKVAKDIVDSLRHCSDKSGLELQVTQLLSMAIHEPIHNCDYASQPEIRIACTQRYTTPAWGKEVVPIVGLHRADTGELYTFERHMVTCRECRSKQNG